MRHQRRGHSPAFFHHRGLLLLAALVLAVCLLYSCAGAPVCGPKGRLVFIPLAQIRWESMTLLSGICDFFEKGLTSFS